MSPANGIKEKFKALIKDKFTHTQKKTNSLNQLDKDLLCSYKKTISDTSFLCYENKKKMKSKAHN